VGAGTLTGDNELEFAENFGGESVERLLCFQICGVYGMRGDLVVESVDARLNGGAEGFCGFVVLAVRVGESVLLHIVFRDEVVQFFGTFVFFDAVTDCLMTGIRLDDFAEFGDNGFHFGSEKFFHDGDFLSGLEIFM
jgi:hypothetical protein